MALYTGVTGYIRIGSGATSKLIAHMSSWEVELSKEIVEVISFGNSYKEKVPSIKDWSATADGAADFDDDANQADLFTAFEEGTLLTLGFGITDSILMLGTGYIESLTITDEADGNVSMSISIAGSNAIVNVIAEPWVTLKVYALGDYVTNDGKIYECISAHTAAATFTTDSAKWLQI